MDVAKQVVLGLHSGLDSVEELHTARPDPRAAEVPVSNRRRVGDEDVCVFRNRVPLLQTLFTPWHIEGPVAELWLPWRAIQLDAAQREGLVLQVYSISDQVNSVLLGHGGLQIVTLHPKVRNLIDQPVTSESLDSPPSP